MNVKGGFRMATFEYKNKLTIARRRFFRSFVGEEITFLTLFVHIIDGIGNVGVINEKKWPQNELITMYFLGTAHEK